MELVNLGFKTKKILSAKEIKKIETTLLVESVDMKEFVSSSFCPQAYPNSAYYLMCQPISNKYTMFWELHQINNQYSGDFNNKKLNVFEKWLSFDNDYKQEDEYELDFLVSVFDSIALCQEYYKNVEHIYLHLFSNSYLNYEEYKCYTANNPLNSISKLPTRITMSAVAHDSDSADLKVLQSYIFNLEASIDVQVNKNMLERTVKPLASIPSIIYKV